MAGPGRYVPDETEGIVRVEDLPKAADGGRKGDQFRGLK